ncbi:hypothetical protein Cni_G00768 [Canna indica]|uniref:FLZ-type domain-containing protein n=1 Tax=Canna indica TaxID=4628 RepID=A0AAQ3Q0X3_9LILI|nr:hypothetical protein Cni_G00768 [Canna indica]
MVLPITKSIFRMGEEEATISYKSRAAAVGIRGLESSKMSGGEGLRILIQHLSNNSNSKVVTNCSSSLSKAPQSGFLKACFLCNKELSPHSDVYMYRGDQGFCSEACRSRQILLDETREKTTREGFLKIRPTAKIQESGRNSRILAVS